MKSGEIFIQDSMSSCGASCIYYIVYHYGGYVPLETIKLDTNTTKNGTNALELVNTLRKYGFISYGERKKIDEINNLPIICHTNTDGYNHFMVITNIKDNKVYTMDPRYGFKTYNKNYFNKIYTGIILSIYPTNIIKKVKPNNINILKEYILSKKTISIILISIVILILELIISLYVKISIKYNINYIFIILSFILYILIYIKNSILINIDNNINKKLNKRFFNHIFNLDYKYITNKRNGEILKKVEDLKFIKDFYFDIIYKELFNIVTLFICVFIMIFISYKLSLLNILFYILYIFITYISYSKLYRLNIYNIESNNNYYNNLSECLNNYESIRNINDIDYLNKRINKTYDKYLNNNINLSKYLNIITCIKSFIINISTLFISILGLFYIKNNLIKWDDLIIFLSISSIFNSSCEDITNTINDYMHFKGLKRHIEDFLSIDKQNYRGDIKDFKTIDIKGLYYSYNNYNCVLNNINIKIYKKDKILIKGKSGCGKSTLVKILSGNINDYKGNILIDGREEHNNLKNLAIYVGQNEGLFMGSIYENITLNKNIDISKIIDICMLNDVINKRVDKLNSIILENSSNISYGEKSRIILARALCKKPQILILDETLSGVSESLENKILTNLLSIEDLTLIYITHRNKDKYFKKTIKL